MHVVWCAIEITFLPVYENESLTDSMCVNLRVVCLKITLFIVFANKTDKNR